MASLLVPAAYLIVLVIAMLVFGRVYKTRLAASRRLEPWFPVHHERDIYVSLLQQNPPANDGLVKAALVRRAVADVQRIFRIREDKTALANLLQKGSIGDDLWNSFLAAEKELEAEILEVVTEAETFKQGWGNLIFQTAAEIVQNEKLREGMNKVFNTRPELEMRYGVTKRIIPTITVGPPPGTQGSLPAPAQPTTVTNSPGKAIAPAASAPVPLPLNVAASNPSTAIAGESPATPSTPGTAGPRTPGGSAKKPKKKK